MTAHALKMNEDVSVVGGQGGADRAQGGGGTSAGTGDVGAEGVDPQGAAGLPEERVENLFVGVSDVGAGVVVLQGAAGFHLRAASQN